MAAIKQIKRKTASGGWAEYDLGANGNNITISNPYNTGSSVSAATNLQTFINEAVDGDTNSTDIGKFNTNKRGLVPKVTNENGYLKGDGTWSVPANTTYNVVSASSNGLAPKSHGSENEYLNGAGEWSTPTDTTYEDFDGNEHGLVPNISISSGKDTYFLNGTGNWTVPTNTTYSPFTPPTIAVDGAAGLVPIGSSITMATSNTMINNSSTAKTSRYWLNVSGWKPIPSATTAQEGFMIPTQVIDLNNLKTNIGTETMGTSATTVKGAIAEHSIDLKMFKMRDFIHIESDNANATAGEYKELAHLTIPANNTGYNIVYRLIGTCDCDYSSNPSTTDADVGLSIWGPDGYENELSDLHINRDVSIMGMVWVYGLRSIVYVSVPNGSLAKNFYLFIRHRVASAPISDINFSYEAFTWEKVS